MYPLDLKEALCPAQGDMDVLDATVGALLRAAAAERPDAPALLEIGMDGRPGRSWTYGGLLADAERLALALSTRFAPGERIVVWSPNSPEWLLVEYACALAGITLVTANPSYQAQELRYVLEKSGAAALFLVHEFRGNPMARIGAEAAAGLPALREITDMEDEAALFASGPRAPGFHEARPEDEAQLQFTSGTTGFPKGARLHHRGLVTNARFYAGRAGVREGAAWSCFMPMFHTAGCGMTALGALQTFGRIVMFRAFDPNAILDRVEADRIELLGGVPTMIFAMLEAQAQKPRDVSSLRMIVSGGSMVAPELVRRAKAGFGCGVMTVYGQTETSPVVTQHWPGDSLEDVTSSVGQPLPQTAISIRRMEDNSVAAIDEQGEICIHGYCRMLGYDGDEAATANTIDAEGWLHTGDLGAMDSRGFVRVTGRVKEMIIRGGENLFPVEIENALLEHPAVAEVAVVGLPDEKWGEIVAAAIRFAPGPAVDVETLRAHCRVRLSPQKTPSVWRVATGFPLTGSGKVKRFALRDDILAGKLAEL